MRKTFNYHRIVLIHQYGRHFSVQFGGRDFMRKPWGKAKLKFLNRSKTGAVSSLDWFNCETKQELEKQQQKKNVQLFMYTELNTYFRVGFDG